MAQRRRISLIALYPQGASGIDADLERLADLPRLRGLTRYSVREQGRAGRLPARSRIWTSPPQRSRRGGSTAWSIRNARSKTRRPRRRRCS
jgi:hypothetical protein